MTKQHVHSLSTAPGQYIVTRHTEPHCVIAFDFQTTELISFTCAEKLDLGAQKKLVTKARAFLKAEINHQAFSK